MDGNSDRYSAWVYSASIQAQTITIIQASDLFYFYGIVYWKRGFETYVQRNKMQMGCDGKSIERRKMK